MQEPWVILVDEADQPIGRAKKQVAHQYGWRHRACSVFLLHQAEAGLQLLWQQRQWRNTTAQALQCPFHPMPNE